MFAESGVRDVSVQDILGAAGVARRTFYRQLYGKHPYGTVDTTPQAVKRVKRQDMVRWHRERFVGKNSFLVVAGDVDPEHVADTAKKTVDDLKGIKFRAYNATLEKFANAVGALATTVRGAIPAMPTRQQVERFLIDHQGP